MKELFETVWKIAPGFMSLVVICSVIWYVAYQVASFQQKFENMNVRLDKVEVRLNHLEIRMTRLEAKVDKIIDYLVEEREAKKGK